MARCEDFPCCGHEAGCCPDYDESGKQLNMKCVCGATVPLTSRFSICESCMRDAHDDYQMEFDEPTEMLNSSHWGNEPQDPDDGEFNDYDEHTSFRDYHGDDE